MNGDRSDEVAPELTRETFVPHVGSAFRVAVAGGIVELMLAKVTEMRRSASFESFSIEFRGPALRPLSQDQFTVEHDDIGQFPLFLGPVERVGDDVIYEAVFNRLVPEP